MADILFFIKVTGAGVPEAVELVKEVGAQIKAGLTGHNLQLKVQICCEQCGDPMIMQGNTLICDSCLADDARDRMLTYYEEAPLHGFPAPMI